MDSQAHTPGPGLVGEGGGRPLGLWLATSSVAAAQKNVLYIVYDDLRPDLRYAEALWPRPPPSSLGRSGARPASRLRQPGSPPSLLACPRPRGPVKRECARARDRDGDRERHVGVGEAERERAANDEVCPPIRRP